jgi:glycerophosphoryl diester phosphodiesterase
MKNILFLCLLFASLSLTAQVKIHAHNDYEKPNPLTNALAHKAYSIEADVFLRNGKLMVAHHAREIQEERTLDALYLLPIEALFKKHKGRISADRRYQPALMIDIKEGGKDAILLLAEKLSSNTCFDRTKNPDAIRAIISGDRGAIKDWISYPAYIYFDGRPNESYDSATLARVAVISDGYSAYASQPDRIKTVLDKAHALGKPFRFWGTPDDEKHWQMFHEAGVDIINTDKPQACRQFFQRKVAAAGR